MGLSEIDHQAQELVGEEPQLDKEHVLVGGGGGGGHSNQGVGLRGDRNRMTKELATMNRKELVGMASLTRYKVYRFYTEQFTLGCHHYMEKDQRETGTELTKELASWSSPGD